MIDVAILTSTYSDPVAHNIYLWLKSYSIKPIIIYEMDLYNYDVQIDINTDNIEITYPNKKIVKFSEVKLFYQLKWNTCPRYIKDENSDIQEYKRSEFVAVRKYILIQLQKQNKLMGFCSSLANNKLYQLTIAKDVGFKIPNTQITNSRQFITPQNQYIQKSIQETLIVHTDKGYKTNYTQKIKKTELDDTFFMTCFQNLVSKKIEIRVFYFYGEMWALAIKTKQNIDEIDVRKNFMDNQTINYPFELTDKIKIKINQLMSELNLVQGSIDLILNQANKFVFLEVNPFGQITLLSNLHFFSLEKMIAKKILDEYKKKK